MNRHPDDDHRLWSWRDDLGNLVELRRVIDNIVAHPVDFVRRADRGTAFYRVHEITRCPGQLLRHKGNLGER